eukprot:6187001-Pleurochrysis_carterae.AAC.3
MAINLYVVWRCPQPRARARARAEKYTPAETSALCPLRASNCRSSASRTSSCDASKHRNSRRINEHRKLLCICTVSAKQATREHREPVASKGHEGIGCHPESYPQPPAT